MQSPKDFIPLQRRQTKSTLQPIAKAEAKAHALTDADIKVRMKRINEDFRHGFKQIQKQHDTVTFFGSARFEVDNPFYQQAELLAKRLVEELDVTIVSGGGRGIMEAANRGASDAHALSVGMTIQLPSEQITNKFVTYSSDFYYFFSRKVALAFAARAYVYFPGGFGTLDELFEILTLKQTGKIKPIPIILVGSEFWKPLLTFIDASLKERYKTINAADTELYELTDDPKRIVQIIAKTS